MSELFVEFICEEIPARMQKDAIRHMAAFLSSALVENGFIDKHSKNPQKGNQPYPHGSWYFRVSKKTRR